MQRITLLSTILLLTAVACGGEETPIDPCAPTVDPVGGFIFPVTVYSGSNGRDPYATELLANFVVGSWEIADPDIATIVPIEGLCDVNFLLPSARLEIKGVGTTTVTAIDGSGARHESTLIVQAYTTADYDIGKTVYMEPNADGTRPSCASCHVGPAGHDHPPSTTGYTPDDVLAKVITMGTYPMCLDGHDGTECECDPNNPACYELLPEQRDLGVPHAWNLTPEEQTGVIVYMRGLRPNGF
jgi:hypothetical protein